MSRFLDFRPDGYAALTESQIEALRSLVADYSDAAIADAWGFHRSTIVRWRAKHGIPRPRNFAGHGTDTKYKGGCRCELCRTAHAREVRAQRARLSALNRDMNRRLAKALK